MKTRSVQFRGIFMAVLFTAGTFLMAATAHAQETDDKKTTEERAKVLTDKMKTGLSLTDEQYPKVEALNLKYMQKNQEILTGSGGKLAKYRAVKSSQDSKRKELKAILTKEQMKKYDELVEQMGNEVKERYKSRNG